ncbi:hypothetical protein MferCBS31731_004136 [Microsporum ferrugineum]
MFSRLIDSVTKPKNPSVVLVVGTFGDTINILHLQPESGEIERFSRTSLSRTFRRNGTKEKIRKQIGIVTLCDGETADKFLDNVETRICKRWDSSMASSPSSVESVAQLAHAVLQPAALDAIHEREGRDSSKKDTHAVFLIHVTRPKPGKILGEPRSFNENLCA